MAPITVVCIVTVSAPVIDPDTITTQNAPPLPGGGGSSLMNTFCDSRVKATTVFKMRKTNNKHHTTQLIWSQQNSYTIFFRLL